MDRSRNDLENWSGHIKRLDEIAKSAGSVWFSFLIFLTFCIITILSLKNADLFLQKLSLKLPIVDVSVSGNLFLLVAPLAIVLTYLYFQLLTHRYVLEFSELPPTLDETTAQRRSVPAHRFVSSWLISEAAALWQARTERPWNWVEVASATVTFALGWLLAPALVLAFWYAYLPRHDLWGALYLATLFMFSLSVGIGMLRADMTILKRSNSPVPERGRPHPTDRRVFYVLAIAVYAALVFGTMTLTRGIYLERGDILRFAHYSETSGIHVPSAEFVVEPLAAWLVGVQLSERPQGWKDFDASVSTANAAYRKQKGNRNAALLKAWSTSNARLSLAAVTTGIDLRHANLENANLVGVFANSAQIHGASFEGADMSRAYFEGVSTCDPYAQSSIRSCMANFKNVTANRANFSGSNLSGAVFDGAPSHGPILWR